MTPLRLDTRDCQFPFRAFVQWFDDSSDLWGSCDCFDWSAPLWGERHGEVAE